MINWINPRVVTGRILLALGIALFLGALIGSMLGVRTSVELNGTVRPGPNSALVISTYTMTSSGVVRVEVWNATRVYYIAGIRGDPRSLLKGLQAFNISVGGEEFKTDFRLGVVYGTSTVSAGRGILGALPVLAKTLRFRIVDVSPSSPGHYVVVEKLGVNEALMVFIMGENVTYRYVYSVGEKHILAPGEVALAGAGLTAAGSLILAPELSSGRRAMRGRGSGDG